MARLLSFRPSLAEVSGAERGPTPEPAPGALRITVLGGLADMERDLIRTHTAEGRSRTKDRGQHMGGPPSQQKEATRRRAQGTTLQELADSYDRQPLPGRPRAKRYRAAPAPSLPVRIKIATLQRL